MKHFTCVIYIIICFLCTGLCEISWIDLSVPSTVLIEESDVSSIDLDCQYKLEGDTTYLVVKWFKDNIPIYHWIRGQEPSVYPSYKNEIESSDKSSEDSEESYTGITILNPNHKSSGLYKCVVQTDTSTKSMEKMMLVADISNATIDLYFYKNENSSHLECVTTQVYPRPAMLITTADNDEISVISSNIQMDQNGLFNGTVVAVDFDDGDDEYRCVVQFEGINVNLTTTLSSGSAVINMSAILSIISLAILTRMF